MDHLTYARAQMGFSLAFHMLFRQLRAAPTEAGPPSLGGSDAHH